MLTFHASILFVMRKTTITFVIYLFFVLQILCIFLKLISFVDLTKLCVQFFWDIMEFHYLLLLLLFCLKENNFKKKVHSEYIVMNRKKLLINVFDRRNFDIRIKTKF
jgi:hypothetical protein